ncbi:hypothetical protein, partial [Bifidobacterium breve]|uniref:hypothetical protein n=1 Tax=Bifidobacterium breve TaxID=1685 RepID=UPI001455A127
RRHYVGGAVESWCWQYPRLHVHVWAEMPGHPEGGVWSELRPTKHLKDHPAIQDFLAEIGSRAGDMAGVRVPDLLVPEGQR